MTYRRVSYEKPDIKALEKKWFPAEARFYEELQHVKLAKPSRLIRTIEPDGGWEVTNFNSQVHLVVETTFGETLDVRVESIDWLLRVLKGENDIYCTGDHLVVVHTITPEIVWQGVMALVERVAASRD